MLVPLAISYIKAYFADGPVHGEEVDKQILASSHVPPKIAFDILDLRLVLDIFVLGTGSTYPKVKETHIKVYT